MIVNLKVQNLGPIALSEVALENFTFFVGRNNAGKSHYLRAIELLLASKKPSFSELSSSFRSSEPITIEATFDDIDPYITLLVSSQHAEAVRALMDDGKLRVRREYTKTDGEIADTKIQALDQQGEPSNPTGWPTILKQLFPEVIVIGETVDAADELKPTRNSAVAKIKDEILHNFFGELNTSYSDMTSDLETHLNDRSNDSRSSVLSELESSIDAELSQEFDGVSSRMHFPIPEISDLVSDVEFFLDDGIETPVQNKGHGLQRNFVLALLSVLAKQGSKYTDRPRPIFLVAELETFLHPIAQQRLAATLGDLATDYQVVTTTHSPFAVLPEQLGGFRRVLKAEGTSVCRAPNLSVDQLTRVTKHLERRGNLEGLFADKIVLLEGTHDEQAFRQFRTALDVESSGREGITLVRVDGKENMRITRQFYLQMGFDEVVAVCDLDYAYSHDIHQLFQELELDEGPLDDLWNHFDWGEKSGENGKVGQKGLDLILSSTADQGEPTALGSVMNALAANGVHVLRRGAPEHYFAKEFGVKSGWMSVAGPDDVLHREELELLLTKI